MRSFIKMFFASLLSMFAFSAAVVIILAGIIGGIASADKPEIGNKAVLVLDLTREFKEQREEDPLNIITKNSDGDTPGLYDMVRMIAYAKHDSAVKGIYVKCDNNPNGFAASEELRDALLDFKLQGKFVIAFGDIITQKAYYVASAANKIYCNPQGIVEWTGLSSELFFLKGTLDKLEIEPQIFYAGKFKSATEPLRAFQMSDANRLQTTAYLNDMYSTVLSAAAQKSRSDTGKLHGLANSGAIQTARDAAKYHLIDAVKYDDEVKSEIAGRLKLEDDKKINFISFGTYAKAVDFKTSPGTDRIALIYAEGDIMDGKDTRNQIGSDAFRNIIMKARLDKKIKAIVFRVNSPGGSALASEEIWRELSLARKVKPVVVSFGDVAASGGYYISCNADSIFAQPNTITGSIGVFGIIPNMKKFLNNKLGITTDVVKTGQFADMPSISRPLTAAEKQFIQSSIDSIYSTFISRVASGRNLSRALVDSIAQGRVWTGQRAVKLGLVDKLGNIDDALACAARMAELTEYSVREYPDKPGYLEELFKNYKNEVKVASIKEEIGEEQYSLLQQLKKVKAMIAIPQTRLPFELNIR